MPIGYVGFPRTAVYTPDGMERDVVVTQLNLPYLQQSLQRTLALLPIVPHSRLPTNLVGLSASPSAAPGQLRDLSDVNSPPAAAPKYK